MDNGDTCKAKPYMVKYLIDGNPFSTREEHYILPNGDSEVRIIYPSELMYSIGEIEAYEKGKTGTLIVKDKQLFEVLSKIYLPNLQYFGQEKFDEYYEKLHKTLNLLWNGGAMPDDCCDFFTESGECYHTLEILLYFIKELFRFEDDQGKTHSVYAFYDEKETEWVRYNIMEWLNGEYKDQFNAFLSLVNLTCTELTPKLIYEAFLLIDVADKKDGVYKTYVMSGSDGLYKIGRSKNPREREAQLLCGNPNIRLLFYIDYDVEMELHYKFSEKRVYGEWFRLSESDVEYIRWYKQNDLGIKEV